MPPVSGQPSTAVCCRYCFVLIAVISDANEPAPPSLVEVTTKVAAFATGAASIKAHRRIDNSAARSIVYLGSKIGMVDCATRTLPGQQILARRASKNINDSNHPTDSVASVSVTNRRSRVASHGVVRGSCCALPTPNPSGLHDSPRSRDSERRWLAASHLCSESRANPIAATLRRCASSKR